MNCEYCGKEFEGRKRKYCGIDCRASKLAEKRKERHSLVCEVCGIGFKASSGGQRCCSRKCGARTTANNGQQESLRAGLKQKGMTMFLDKFNRESGEKWEYVSGYKNNNSKFKVRCKKCGMVQERNASLLRQKKYEWRCACYYETRRNFKEKVKSRLNDILRDKKERDRKDNEALREKKRLMREIKKKAIRADVAAICVVCEVSFETKRKWNKYCSSACRNKAANYKKELRRRRIYKNGDIDSGITVDATVKRYKGFCYLCGEKVDLKVDCNHPNAPTREHLKPISMGGQHVWENVLLAHRKCNERKGTGHMFKEDGGQMKMCGW